MSTYQIVFLVLSALAATPVLIYYYRRSPNPRFRPSFGEMSLVTMLVGLLCFSGSWFLGGLMDDPEQLKPDASFGTIDLGGPGLDSGDEDAGGGAKKQGAAERRFQRSFDRAPKEGEKGSGKGEKNSR